jgi:hypothetical protein
MLISIISYCVGAIATCILFNIIANEKLDFITRVLILIGPTLLWPIFWMLIVIVGFIEHVEGE